MACSAWRQEEFPNACDTQVEDVMLKERDPLLFDRGNYSGTGGQIFPTVPVPEQQLAEVAVSGQPTQPKLRP